MTSNQLFTDIEYQKTDRQYSVEGHQYFELLVFGRYAGQGPHNGRQAFVKMDVTAELLNSPDVDRVMLSAAHDALLDFVQRSPAAA